MDNNREQQIRELFDAAIEMPSEERAIYLATATIEESLREEVHRLIASSKVAPDFLSRERWLGGLFGGLETQPPALMEGRRIGPYQVIRELGVGGMGTVYLAHRADEVYEKQVAIKLVRPDALARFYQERRILARLEHPNIARLIDGGQTDDGLQYLVMEYVEGRTITDYCAHRKLSLQQRLQLFRQVCDAVQHAHRNLVIHRDLKPTNILVDESGAPKLLDFGIAKLVDPEEQSETLTQAGMLALTPEYASPEQVRGETVATTTDVYSLGVLLYELLTGSRPYRIQSRFAPEIIRAVCEEEPEKPGLRAPALRGDLENIMLMALRKDAAARYQSVEEFGNDLRRYLEGEMVAARPATFRYRAEKYIKRNRALVAAGTVLFLALLVGLGILFWQLRASRSREQAQRRELYSIRMMQASNDWFGDNPRSYNEILQSPPIVPQAGEEDLRGLEYQYLWHLGHRERFTFDSVDTVDFSYMKDESGYLLSVRDNREFTLWQIPSGKRILVRNFPAPIEWRNSIPASGNPCIIYIDDGHALMRMDLLEGTKWQVLRDQESTFSYFGGIEGKEWLTAGPKGRIKRWDWQTGRYLGAFETGFDRVTYMGHTPQQGDRVFVCGNAGEAQIWDPPRNSRLMTLPAGSFVISAATPYGLLLTRIANGPLIVYDQKTLRKLNSLSLPASVGAVELLPNKQVAAAIPDDNSVRIYDLPSLRIRHTLRGHTEWINAFNGSKNGKWIATASSDRTVKLWDAKTFEELATIRGHLDDVSLAYFIDHAGHLISKSEKTIKVWPMSEVLRPEVVRGHAGKVFSVAFSPDGKLLASANQDRTIRLWNPATGVLVNTLTGHPGQIFCVSFSPDGKHLVSSGEGSKTQPAVAARTWDVATGKAQFELCCHREQIHFASYSPNGRMIATASDDRTIKLWDAVSGRELRSLGGAPRELWSLAFTPDGRSIAGGTDRGEVFFWDIETGRLEKRMQAHPGSIWSIAFSPDGRTWATASGDATARLWDTATRTLLREFKGHADGLFELAFSPDGTRLATASNDKTVRFWNVATGHAVLNLQGHTAQVWSVAFSPDGRTLATGSWDQTIRLYRAAER